MPDLKQALKDFVATSNSGKYADEATLLSKFPELKGYDIQLLRDFVATSNSGKYATEDEVFSKFPEFNFGSEPTLKKKDVTASSLEGGSSVLPKIEQQRAAQDNTIVKPKLTEPVKQKEPAPQKDEQGWLLNTVSALDKGFYKNFIGSPVKGLGTLLQGATAKITGGSGKAFISDALINFGDYFNKTIDELTPQDESFKGSLSDQFGQAFGQVASLVATGGATGAASKGAALVGQTAATAGKGAAAVQTAKTLATELASPVAVSAGLSMGQSEFERAKAAGATDDQAFEAFYKNAAVGSVLEKIPVMQFMKRFNQASAGSIANYIKTKGVAGITGGLEEMTTEVLQQLYANKSAQDIYNTNQDLFEGVGESGGVGFGVGFLLNAMGANAKILRSQGKKDEADMVENQMKSFETQAANGGPSSYKLNGIKIESPEVINNLIDNMNAADLAKANIDIKNDPALKIKMQNKIVSSSIKEQVRQGNPDLNEPSLNAITDLELQLKKLEGNTTQTGKDKAAVIRQQIKNIQENQLQEEVTGSKKYVVDGKEITQEEFDALQGKPQGTKTIIEAPEKTAERIARIAEIEQEVAAPNILPEAKAKLQTELETLKAEQDAIQKQATNESVLRTEQPQVGLQQVGEGNQGLEVAPTGTQKVTPEGGTQEIVKAKFEGPITQESLETITEKDISDVTEQINNGKAKLNIDVFPATELGTDNKITNNQNVYLLHSEGKEIGILAVNNKKLGNRDESSISSVVLHPDVKGKGIGKEMYRYVNNDLIQNGKQPLKSDWDITPDAINVWKSLVKSGEATQIGISEKNDIPLFQMNNPIIQEVSSKTQPTTQTQQNGETATTQTTTSTAGPIAGNRLFNKPLTKAKEVANGYYQRVFNTERPKFAGTRKLDEDRGKRIADAYIAMKDDPTNPEVRAAYDAMSKETLDQYKDFVDAGFTIEVDNEEPYNNSQEMIDDLRNNNRIKIFSTEAGFGSNPITEEQRQRNPLLQDSGFKDAKGNTLLVNDVFRAIHDFYGHAELGNSFGPKGEENAWNIHARMFSPLARRAMTTETRGQNSYVNFSGVNERIDKMREEARKLREQGDEQGAKAIVDRIYQEGLFAEQKIGLLPEEFSQFDEAEEGDVTMRPQGLQERDTQAEPVVTEVVAEEEVFEPITASDVKTPAFNRENALFYEEDERETDSGRTSTYLSSVTVEATNTDEETLGTITKITDEDKIFYFTAEDADGSEINLDGFETLGDAKKAIADSWNKIQKKEFDKAAKKKAKDKEKAKAKAEAKKAKAVTQPAPIVEVEEIEGVLGDLLDLDVKEKDNLDKVYDALDTLDKNINKKLLGNANDATLAIPLGTVQVIVKALKALVKGGMNLRDAIKKVSKDSNVSQELIKNIISISPIQDDFNALMIKADELIARQKRRGIADAKIVSNLDTFIRKSDAYKNANDAQKKIMEREARIKMGVGPKRAVSVGRVLGSLKDITNITRAEKMLVIKRIRDLSRDAAKDIAKEIREMAAGGKITAVQAANIVARFGKVNMLNEVSVSNFVDYMAKVFANAEYANKIDVAKSKLRAAKKNIVTKIGIADGLVGPLQRLFSINPTLIPDQYLERYLELVDMFSARQAVLNLEEKSVVTKDVNDILNEIDNEQSKADELADKFNYSENKVFKDDKLDYSASIKKMLEDKEIDEKQADIMRKYKEDIAPQVEETDLTEAEAEQEKNELVSVVKKSRIDGSELPSKDERDKANQLAKLINTDAVSGLTNTELKNLLKVIDNINNNYFPHYAELMIEKLNAKNKAVGFENAVEKGKIAKFSKLYSNAKAVVAMQGRTGVSEMIRRNPLFYIDQLFGNFKTKEIFDSIFEDSAKAAAIFKTELSRVQNVLENAEQKVANSFKLDSNKTTMSKFKMMTYMIQLEYDSNKGNKEVNPAADYLKATVKHIDDGKSQFGERDAEMLQDILNKYTDADGNIDNDKLYNSFNQAEKDAIKDIRGINESLREKAEFTAAIIRGDRINPLNNYVHLNVLHEHQPNDLTTGSAFVTEYNNSLRPSTKAKSLIARTGKVSPLNFNVFSSAERGAKFVLMDYNLTEPIRTARKTINEATKNLEEKGRIPKEQRQILNAVNNAFEESVEGLLTNSFTQDSLLDMASDYFSKQGYRAVLAGTNRFIAELGSNIGFAVISDPKAMDTAFKDRGVIMSADAPVIMENLKSKQTSRIFPTDALSGRLVDASILSQASGIKGGKAKNIVANKIQQIYNLSGKKVVNTVELIADTLISTPDKATMRPMWFGSFANEFKTITGNDVDFNKIAANDEAYMTDNKEALDKATKKADERSVMIGATDNPFMGILKGTVKPEQKPLLRAFNNFNNFMTKFLIFEFVTARTALNAAIGNGSLTKKQGAAVLAAVTTRMVVYGLVIQMLGNGFMGLIFDDDEPETEKSFLQKLGQAFASAFSSLLIGRDFGNAVKTVLNYGVETANEEYLDFLREGDYDPYKDGIANTLIPRDDSKATDLGKLLMNAGGAYTPTLNTAAFIYKKATEKPKKKEDAIARREKELNVRIPLEILGNLGLVPLYKDVRKVVMKDIYGSLEKAEREAADKKKVKAEKLQGYDNESDMKRYDPELWERTYGPEAPDYDEKQAAKELKREKDRLKREMKDEIYEYTPKSKRKSGGFGSSKKKKGGFGQD